MIKSILLSIGILLGTIGSVEGSQGAKQNTNGYGHQVKMNKFRVQKETLYSATRNSIIEMDEAAAIIGVESGWVTHIKNKHGSSATGLFQYIDNTWIAERKMFHKQANIPKNASRTNAKANIAIGVMGLERNKTILAKRMGVPVDEVLLGDLYIAHFLGVDRASRVIKGNPNALMSKYIKITKANRGLLTYKGKVRTASQFRTAMNNKLEKERKLYKKELMEFQLAKLIESKTEQPIVINSPPQRKWYEQL